MVDTKQRVAVVVVVALVAVIVVVAVELLAFVKLIFVIFSSDGGARGISFPKAVTESAADCQSMKKESH